MTIPLDTIKGLSVGSYGTVILLPTLKVALDIGRCPEAALQMDTVLVSHGHMDHLGGIPRHCARRELRQMGVPTYVMSRSLVEGFEGLMQAWRVCEPSRLEYNLIPLDEGERIPLDRQHWVEPFPTDHAIPSQGYMIWEERKKLKLEYRGLPGKELGALRKSGVELEDLTQFPELAFTGDTNISFLERDAVRKARILIMEVTFLDDRVTVEEAHNRTKHVHLDEVIERADLFENEHIIFIHPSMRYRANEIWSILVRRLPENLAKRVTMLPPFEEVL